MTWNLSDVNTQAAQGAWQRAYAREAALPELLSPWPQRTGRGERHHSDALAAWRRWHDPEADTEFTAALWPCYAALERGRVETLAGRDLPGVARNLSEINTLLPQAAGLAQLYRMARILLAGGELPDPVLPQPSFLQRLLNRRTGAREERFSAIAAALREISDLEDGIGFARRLHPLLPELAQFDENGPELPGQEIEDESGEERAGESSLAAREERHWPVCPGYAIHSRQWDQTLVARGTGLTLSHLDEDQRRQVRHLAHRLQRRLLAARLRHWRFDQEEGLLDSRRLARLLTPGQTAVFRQESEEKVPQACVILLVDQSGSMRGERMEMAVLAVDLAVQTLEACRVRCEVLGYTTRYGCSVSENPVRAAWRASGSPDSPGRLNALQHWVYKTAEQPWRSVRKNLSGLLLPGRENIDGEALEWASARLLRRPETRKVLLVLSDGTPYDEATVQAHGRGFLESHLHAVINRIERDTRIHLAAIGSGQNVGRYYRHAFTMKQANEVADLLFAHLGEILTVHG